MSKTGRNDPCPCGSGKKYKKCCLGKDEAQRLEHLKVVENPVDSLRSKIMEFLEEGDFGRFFKEAFNLYWKTLEDDLEPPAADDVSIGAFTKWFIHDYPLPDHGKPLISVYLESNPRLTDVELQILKDWQDTYISVFQITKVEEGHGVWAEDIFTGDECFLHDVSTSRGIKRWQLMVSRKVWVLDEWQLSAVGTILYPQDKKPIYDLMMDHYRQYRKKKPKKKMAEFLHEKGYLLQHFVLTRHVKPLGMKKVFTSHGEELVFYKALYDVLDLDELVVRFSGFQDYQMTNRNENDEGEIIYSFDWLQRGESANSQYGKPLDEGISVKSFYFPRPGEEGSLVLGNIEVARERLKLSVMGEERFKVGKIYLEQCLEGLIRHRVDSIQSFESMMKEGRKPSSEKLKRLETEVEKQILNQMLEDHYRKWPDMKIPALDGKTPRNAVKTKKGRREVEDLIRNMEFIEEMKMEKGEVGYDFSWLRRTLGLD